MALLVASLGCVGGRLLLAQYAPILRRRRKLPPMDIGLPLIGHTWTFLRYGLWGSPDSFFRQLRERMGPAFVMNFFFENVVVIDYPLYEKYLQKLELTGQVVPTALPNGFELIGKKSILLLPAGRGVAGAAHKKIRRQVFQVFVPKQLLLMLPQVEAICRQTLESMVRETSLQGHTSLQPHIDALTLKIACASILGSFADPGLPYLNEIGELCKTIINGIVAVPIDLGSLTTFGRARQAKRNLNVLMEMLLQTAQKEDPQTTDGRRNVLAQLTAPTPDGEEPLTLQEIQDTLVTLAIAGQITTSDAIPGAVAELGKRPEWVSQIAEDKPCFENGLEQPTAGLQFIREAMRMRPPVTGFRRTCPNSWIDLGEHGSIPPGWQVLTTLDYTTYQVGGHPQDFDPTRWTSEAARRSFPLFGGNTPHACVGKNLAVMEMQCFIHMLCHDYDFEVLHAKVCVGPTSRPMYENGLPVRVRHKRKGGACHGGA